MTLQSFFPLDALDLLVAVKNVTLPKLQGVPGVYVQGMLAANLRHPGPGFMLRQDFDDLLFSVAFVESPWSG